MSCMSVAATHRSYIPAYPLQSHHLSNLLVILRSSNDRYRQIAQYCKDSLRPTFHARKRAVYLGLQVDTVKAVNCPQKHVSVQPLPIIDPTPSPGSLMACAGSEELYGDATYVQRGAPVIPYDVPLRRSKYLAIPPIVIPTKNDPRRRCPSMQEEVSHFSAITPEQTVPIFNVHVWDSNMDLQHTEQLVPDEVASEEGSECTEALTPVHDEIMMFYDSEDIADLSSSSSSGSSRLDELVTPGDDYPMATSNKRKSFITEDDTEMVGQPPKYFRKLDRSASYTVAVHRR